MSPALVGELERIELLGRLKANWIFVEDLPDPPRHHGHLVDLIRVVLGGTNVKRTRVLSRVLFSRKLKDLRLRLWRRRELNPGLGVLQYRFLRV